MTTIYGDEYEHVDDSTVTLIAELRKIKANGETVTFTPAMTDYVLTVIENNASSIEAITGYLLEQGLVSPTIVQQWKRMKNGR